MASFCGAARVGSRKAKAVDPNSVRGEGTYRVLTASATSGEDAFLSVRFLCPASPSSSSTTLSTRLIAV
jgi:hypothetical protein